MKKIFFVALVFVQFFGEGISQKLILESEYKDALEYQSNKFQTFPTKDGGMVFIKIISSSHSLIKEYQAIWFDQNGKQTFKFSTEGKDNFDSRRHVDFNYNPNTDALYSIQAMDYIEAKKTITRRNYTISKITTDGKVSTIKDLSLPLYERGSFFYDNKLVMAGLNNKHADKKDETDQYTASGEYEIAIIDEDMSKSTSSTLTLPEFIYKEGYTYFELLNLEDGFIYFVNEGRFLTSDDKIVFNYEFRKYDLKTNTVALTKKLPFSFGEQCPRGSSAICDKSTGYVNFFFDREEKAIFMIGSYGEGYPKVVSHRRYDGTFIVRLKDNFEIDYAKLIPASKEMLNDASYHAYSQSHVHNLIKYKGKNIISCYLYMQGSKNMGAYFMETDLKNGESKNWTSGKEEHKGKIIGANMKTFKVSALAEVGEESNWDFVASGTNTFLIISGKKPKKYFIYLLE